MHDQESRPGHVEPPPTRKTVRLLLWGLCALTVILEFLVLRENHFPAEDFFGFYAALGFGGCLGLILLSRGLDFFLKAPTDYYDDDDDE